jgi:hypothetical protein
MHVSEYYIDFAIVGLMWVFKINHYEPWEENVASFTVESSHTWISHPGLPSP